MKEFQTQISTIHDAFLLEYTKTSIQLGELYNSVNSFIERIVKENNDDDDCLQVQISKVQDVCFFLKSFCTEAELNSSILTPKVMLNNKKDDKIQADVKTKSQEQTDDFNKIIPHECYRDIFTYTPTDPSKYKAGFEALFAVTYIKNIDDGSFFLMDAKQTDIVIKQPDFRYDIIPDKGIIFGLLLDGCIVRAVRENDIKRPTISFRVLLIDFGEILEITKDFKMYRLPEKLQQIPGMAIFCKLSTSESSDSSIPPPLPNQKTTPNSHHVPSPSCSTSKSGLTQEQIDVLYEEPLNTENALEAVMGYTPQDDKRICKFFDPKTNACFKGANCNLEHTTILKDGWTKDKAICKVKIHSENPLPKVGKKIRIFVSFVVDVEKFYAQIIDKNCKSFEDLTVEKIVKEMNDTKMIANFKRFTMPPGAFELVFALFTDGLWYRAKILQKLSDVSYKVYYVDYGNCSSVSIDEIRKWEDLFDRFPFQAVECRLDNVYKIRVGHKDAIAHFESMVLHRSIRATVTCNIQQLHVTMEDDRQFDIGEQLCVLKFAHPKVITESISGQIPG